MEVHPCPPSRIPASLRIKVTSQKALRSVRRSSQELVASLLRQVSICHLNKQHKDTQELSSVTLPQNYPLSCTEWNDLWVNCVKTVWEEHHINKKKLRVLEDACTEIKTQNDIEVAILNEAKVQNVCCPIKIPNTTKYHKRKNTILDLTELLNSIQQYLSDIGYNHLGNTFFAVPKQKSAHRIFELAKEICRESLPIKCLEAVVISLWLTAQVKELDRFTLAFKSQHHQEIYRHIVLVVRFRNHDGKWIYGCLGLSRRNTLMWKKPTFKNLVEVVNDYRAAYEECGHSLLKVKFGLPITHDISSIEPIVWKRQSVVIADRLQHLIENDIMEFSASVARPNIS